MLSRRAVSMRLTPIIEDQSPHSSVVEPPGLNIDSSMQDDVSSLGDSTFQQNKSFRSTTGRPFKNLEMSQNLYGRDEEVTKLRDAYDRISKLDGTGRLEAAIISGEAGSGKSRLLDVGLRQYVAKTKGGFFVSGKYCQLQPRSPYSGIVESFTDLVDLIVQEGGEIMHRVQRVMKGTLGTHARTMASLIPNLSRLLGEQHPKESLIDLQGGNLFVLFKRLCRAFLRAASTSGHPIVMFMDDIQWAERQSLEVLQGILSDPASSRLLVVCSFRSDEESMNEDLVWFLNRVDTVNIRLTHLELGTLPLKEVNRIISEQTGIPFQATLKLSRLVYKRTKGNCYFVTQFLTQMERNKYIYFSEKLQSWAWDMKVIEANTSATENVVRLLEVKVSELDPELQALLKLLSFVGQSFSTTAVEGIINSSDSIDLHGSSFGSLITLVRHDNKRLFEMLQVGEMQGFIELVSPSSYKWTHHKVQSCLHSLTQDGGESDLVHYWVGTALWEKARLPDADHEQIFDAAFHLNHCHNKLVGSFQALELAKLNVRAARISLFKCAFESASSSLLSAIALVDESSLWVEHYPFALELYTLLAEASYVGGDFQQTSAAIDKVMTNATSFNHKLRVYDIKMEMLHSRGEYTAAQDVGFDLLHLLGEQFPKKPSKVDVAYDLTKMKFALRKKSNSEILALPNCEDKTKIEAMRILSTVATIVYLKKNEALPFALVTLRLLKLTFRHGISDLSPHGFACFAVLLSSLGLHSQAYRYGRLSNDLLHSRQTKSAESRTTLALNHFVLHWREPLNAKNFMHGYKYGMATGDLNSAFISLGGALLMNYYVAETPLDEIETHLQSGINLMFEYHQYSTLQMILPFHQYILNMLGRSTDPCILEGEAMDKVARLPANSTPDSYVANGCCKYLSLVLAYNFDRMDLMETLLGDVAVLPAIKGHYVEHMFELWKGLAYLRLYRASGKRNCRARAEKIIKQIQKWLDEGVVSCHPRYLLLHAIYLSMRGSPQETEQAFDMAIQASAQSRNLHLKALAAENAVEYFELVDTHVARMFLNQALTFYHEFGFQSKVTLLRQMYPTLLA